MPGVVNYLKLFGSQLLIGLLGLSSLDAQTDKEFPELRLYISTGQATVLRQTEPIRLTLKNPTLVINSDTVSVKEIHDRGASTLHFSRKSLSIDLLKSAKIVVQGRTIKLHKFDLLNLAMDKNLWRNRWSYLNLAEMNLFPLFNSYCTLWLNDKPQGIYLLVEKPNAGSLNNSYMIRRGSRHEIDHEYVNELSKSAARELRERYKEIYRNVRKSNGQALFDKLNQSIQLDSYMRWLAFNYLIRNGDYSDELYFYVKKDSSRFHVLPWDYDDIFMKGPHEGVQARQSIQPDKLLFSLEDDLDRAIASDSILYREYCSVATAMLSDRTDDAIDHTFQQVRQELERIAHDKPSATASAYLDQHPFTWEAARDEIEEMRLFVQHRRLQFLKALGR